MLYSTARPTFQSQNQELRNFLSPLLQHPLVETLVNAVAERVVQIVIPPIAQFQEKEEPRYYTRKKVCDLIHVTLPTLSRLIKDGIIPSKKVGIRVLIPANFIDEALAEKKVFQYKRAKK